MRTLRDIQRRGRLGRRRLWCGLLRRRVAVESGLGHAGIGLDRGIAEELEQQNAELREQVQPDRLPAIQRWARERQVAQVDEPGL